MLPRKRGSNAVVYDASVKSLVVYLSVVMFLPYGRIDSFFREVFGLGGVRSGNQPGLVCELG